MHEFKPETHCTPSYRTALAVAAVALSSACEPLEPFLDNLPLDTGAGGSGETSTEGPEVVPDDLGCEGEVLGTDSLLALLEADLLSEAPADRPFLRYFNSAPVVGSEDCAGREVAEDALAKLLNSTSTAPELVRPLLVNAGSTLHRIDLRDYDWDREVTVAGVNYSDGWEAVRSQTDLAFEITGGSADAVAAATGSAVSVLPLDAFVHAASKGALYHALLGVPEQLGSLVEGQLGVDRSEPGQRGGTTESELVIGERLFERYELGARAGALWLIYHRDYFGDRTSMFLDPMGEPADEQVAIYTLPNGLNAFALFDADGTRLEESSLMLDQSQFDFVFRAGISFLGWYGQGLIPFEDEVRPFVEENSPFFSPEVQQAVDAHYPSAAQWNGLFISDNFTFTTSMHQLGILVDQPEPISETVLRYEEDLTVSDMARALLVSEAEFLEARSSLTAVLGLESVGRNAFTKAYPSAFCILHQADENQLRDCQE